MFYQRLETWRWQASRRKHSRKLLFIVFGKAANVAAFSNSHRVVRSSVRSEDSSPLTLIQHYGNHKRTVLMGVAGIPTVAGVEGLVGLADVGLFIVNELKNLLRLTESSLPLGEAIMIW
jgi:hypothetical protein